MTIFLLLQRRTEAIAAWTCRSACCAHVTTSPCSLRDEPAQCQPCPALFLLFFFPPPFSFQIAEHNAGDHTWVAAPHARFASQAPGASAPLLGVKSNWTEAVLRAHAEGMRPNRHARFSLLLPSSCFPSSPLLLRLLWPSVPTFFESCCQRRNDQQQLLNTVSLLTVRRMQPHRWLM